MWSGCSRANCYMKSAIIIVRDNAYGLTRDAVILKAALENAGVSVSVSVPSRSIFHRLLRRHVFDFAFHMERVFPAWLNAAKCTMLLPNQERFPRRHIGRLRRVDRVLAKSRHAEEIFSKLGVKTSYCGFSSQNRFLPGIQKNWCKFFHLAGGSTLKSTEIILDLWRTHPEWPELVLIQKLENAPQSVPANVLLIAGYIDDTYLRQLQNSCGIHLCPSRAEGWGHYILEAMSCGAVVITTDAPPMNEHVTSATGFLVQVDSYEPQHLGTNYTISPQELERSVLNANALSSQEARLLGERARDAYLSLQPSFFTAIAEFTKHI